MFGAMVDELDELHRAASSLHRDMLRLIARLDRDERWLDDGARSLAHWLSMRYGISSWKAARWIAAAHALEGLPRLSDALGAGAVSLDKVVELARFATRETESELITWSARVSCAAIRRRADREVTTSTQKERDAETARFLDWWYLDDERRLGLQAELPAAQGAIVVRAIQRMAEQFSSMPGEEDAGFASSKHADALVAICSARIANDADPDRATVVVHARADRPTSGTMGGGELENGPALHPLVVKRLLCEARVQMVEEDRSGNVVALGRMRREPPVWMVRQVRYRDRECRFPGCGATRFTQAHHLRWWRHGGATALENLLLICSFHHKLVHELGWTVKREPEGDVGWFRPDGTRYRAGPSPGGSGERRLVGVPS